MNARRLLLRLACGVGLAGAVLPAAAQQCPDRTVHLVVGYSAGGTGDIVATAVADVLSRRLDQKVVVDYRSGGSGSVAAQEVAKAGADGCTLLVGQTAEIAINPTVLRNLGYDPARDLKPIGLV